MFSGALDCDPTQPTFVRSDQVPRSPKKGGAMISVRQFENLIVVRPETHRLDEMMGRQLVAAACRWKTVRS